MNKLNLLIWVTEKNELRLFFFFCFAKLQRCKIQMAVTITLGSGILTVVKALKDTAILLICPTSDDVYAADPNETSNTCK